MPLPQQPPSKECQLSLVVLLHAFRHTPDRLELVAREVGRLKPRAHIITPKLPLSMWSRADLNDVAADVVTLIEQQVQHRADRNWGEFDEIILVGHSTGSMISRQAYLILCGETSAAPFEHCDAPDRKPLLPRRPWAHQVTRIVQLSGMNGGWSVSHHMGLRRSLEFSIGSAAAHLVLSATGRRLAIDHIRRGAPFLSGLRLQWLAMQNQAREAGRETAMVVQLLGTIDDLVSPDDNLDLVTGNDFLYLDVPQSGHVEMIQLDSSEAGRIRRDRFALALTGTAGQIKSQSVVPSDPALIGRNSQEFTDVVFVIHGIRDTGYWTHKIARKVQAAGGACGRRYATETSTYGYFPMLSFLLPWRRRDKVAWLMDRYVRAKSLYPGARFAYVGHSNGTYLLANALRDNPACRFENVVFAGSVVRKSYDWAQAARRGQINAILNYVATDDIVVAGFPGALERLRLQDLGSAGHSGFEQARRKPEGLRIFEVRFVKGGHGAAMSEQYWEEIATFICTGVPPPQLSVGGQSRSAVLVGKHPWILWALILSALTALTWAIWQIPQEGLRVLTLIGLWWVVRKILTQF